MATGLFEYLIFDNFKTEMTIHNGSDFFSDFVMELTHFVMELTVTEYTFCFFL